MPKLTAVTVGFYKGNRVKAGQSFDFEGDKLPKWARLAGDAEERPAAKPKRGDTKPLAAAQAAAKKATDAAGTADASLA